MTRQDLRSLFPSTAYFYAADDSYAKPTAAWLKSVFWPWFYMDRTNRGLGKWERRNDCDNWSRAYAQAAADCHAASDGKEEGLAVGQFYYHRDTGGAHAIVAAVTENGLTFIEPQNGRAVALSQKEISTCWLILF